MSADRALHKLDRPGALRLLERGQVGRLAVNLGPRAPVIRPVNYIFDAQTQSVVFRAAAGSKLHAVRNAATAVFEVDEIDAARRTGWSVIVSGVPEEVTEPAEVRRLSASGLDSWFPAEFTQLIRIRVGTVSGRVLAEPGDPAPSGTLESST